MNKPVMDPGSPPDLDGKRLDSLPRNVWAVSLTSFLTDVSSEMVINVLPLFLFNILGVRTSVIGLIEGIAEALASLLKLFSGWFSDRIGQRKSVAVTGYAISALSKPFYLIATTWPMVALVRWGDRVGKGIRTAPRDALIADSVSAEKRGISFGIHRAADSAGAVLGIGIALLVVNRVQAGVMTLTNETFRTLVWISIIPAFAAVAILALLARDVPVMGQRDLPSFGLRGLGRPFLIFLAIVGLFDLGNSADAFLILRAQERGLSVSGILIMLLAFNVVYAALSAPAGAWSDRVGRRRVLIIGWLLYTLIYGGFALARSAWQVGALYVMYGIYYGLTYGTAKAMVADLVPAAQRGMAFGTYNATLGLLDFPASLLAGILWQGVGTWSGFGPSAPFYFGAALALTATVALALWHPPAVAQA
jgi:MFS family permease